MKARLRGVDLQFLTARGVFSYRKVDRGTIVLIDSMEIPEKGNVLDLGCGWGPIGITISATHPQNCVIMTDINKRAIWLATQNVSLNKVTAEVRWGELYDPVGDAKFDAIITNPPISAGRSLVSKAIEEANHHLSPRGSLQLVARTNKGAKVISIIMENVFGNVQEIEKKSGYRVLCSHKKDEGSEDKTLEA
ncbi:MAG: methyltransferase [Promethearchaeati archaeon SRVP18_Atabeyarchaeia-1]